MRVAILFDLDGTLIDSTEAILDGFAYAFSSFGLEPPPKEKILALIGHPLDFMFVHLGVTSDPMPFVERYKERYRQIFKAKTKLLPKAKEAVLEASRLGRVGIVTTKTGKYSKELMEHLGLMDYFDVLIGPEDVHHPKPHPEPILKALRHLGIPPQEAFMIGDTCLDALAAKDADVCGLGVRCGYGKKELDRCFDHLFADPLLAVRFVKRLKGYHH
ncbi:MAG: hydrolase [Epsilonproteobacteria bacterium]|nr:hydrolase [Campylobacterota bacterium]NPA63884.1 HAD family hydrolase [Campylobacterota bacterium]